LALAVAVACLGSPPTHLRFRTLKGLATEPLALVALHRPSPRLEHPSAGRISVHDAHGLDTTSRSRPRYVRRAVGLDGPARTTRRPRAATAGAQ
jgi:hypothetical protein